MLSNGEDTLIHEHPYADQEGLKLIGTHQVLFYIDDINVLGASVRTVKENTQTSVSNETGLELYNKKTKYMVMSQDQHAVQNHNIRVYLVRTDHKVSHNVVIPTPT